MAGKAQEKTEQATPRRIREARRKGQVARSTDLTGALCLLAMVVLLYAVKDRFIADLQQFLTWYLSQAAYRHVAGANTLMAVNQALVFSLKLLFPFFTVSLLVVIATNLVQVGFMFSTEALRLKAEKLNPLNGLKRMFSTRSLVELAKSVLKVVIIGGVTYYLIRSNLEVLLLVLNRTPGGIYQDVLNFILKVALWGALAYLVLALLDYLYQRYDYQKNLMMSKQEVKEEFKQTEGDPHIKSKQKEMFRSMSLNKIIGEVPRATVVVTNPTRLAVALQYRRGEMPAPRVTAKGAGRLAARIRDIARENKVPLVEEQELARFLYQNVEVDQEIPLEVYQAVAEVLALVYRLKAKENYRRI
jgi:flagellar biosynthetic protein FlhB